MRRFIEEMQQDFSELFRRHRMALKLLAKVAERAEELKDERLFDILDDGLEDLLLATLEDSKRIRRQAKKLNIHEGCDRLLDEFSKRMYGKEEDNDIRREQN